MSAAVALAAVAALWLLGQVADAPRLRLTTALLAVLAATVAFAPGLAGQDPQLDRTAAIAWAPRRAAHLVALMLAVAVLGTLTTVAGAPLAETAVLVRGAAGLGGLLALGAVVLGRDWAWLPSTGWTVMVLLFGPRRDAPLQEMLTWMVQPAGTAWATVTASAIAVVGVVGYAVWGGHRSATTA